jgi:hypothetical protein
MAWESPAPVPADEAVPEAELVEADVSRFRSLEPEPVVEVTEGSLIIEDSPFATVRRRSQARSGAAAARAGRIGLVWWLILAAALIIVAVIAAVVFRGAIVRANPAFSGLYPAMGLAADPTGDVGRRVGALS